MRKEYFRIQIAIKPFYKVTNDLHPSIKSSRKRLCEFPLQHKMKLLPLNWWSSEQVHFISLTDTLHGCKMYFTQWCNKVSLLTTLTCPFVLDSCFFN